MNGPLWRWARRLTQASMLLILLLAPVLGGWQRLDEESLAAWNTAGRELPGPLYEALPRGDAPGQAYGALQLVGGGAAVSAVNLPAMDPLASAIAVMAGRRGPWFWFAIAIPVILGLLLGRVFCGWLCPFGTLSRVLASVRRRIPWVRTLVLPARRPLRYGMLVAALIAGVAGVHTALYLLLPHVLVQQAVYAAWLHGGGSGVLGLLGGLLLAGLLFGPTAWCAFACPTGAALGLLGRARQVRVGLVEPKQCGKNCNLCDIVCWQQLKPSTGVPGPDCDLCARCFTACPSSNLHVSRDAPRLSVRLSDMSQGKPADSRVTRIASLILLAVSLSLLWSAPASARTKDRDDARRPRPRLALSAEREVYGVGGDTVTVAVAAVDMTGIRMDADDTRTEQGTDVSVFIARGNIAPADARGMLKSRTWYGGKLHVHVVDADGEVLHRLAFTGPKRPWSAARPTVFRRRVSTSLSPGARVVVQPVEGWMTAPVPFSVPNPGGLSLFEVLQWWLVGLLTYGGLLAIALGLGRQGNTNGSASAVSASAASSGAVVSTLMLAVVALAALFPANALAHHNKGLPHYGYYENYPQVPTEEHVALDGRWEIGATIFNFQGLVRSQADTPTDVKIYLYLYDLIADKAYTGPLKVDIRLNGKTVAHFDRLEVDEEAVYSTRETLPESGTYNLVAHVEGKEVKLPFYIDLAGDGINWWIVFGIGFPVAIVFGLALFGKKGRRRRRKRRGGVQQAAIGALLLTGFSLIAPTPGYADVPPANPAAVAQPETTEEGKAKGEAKGAVCVHCGMIDCPMDHSKPVDRSKGDVCPKCGMVGCNMDHYKTDDGGEVMIMAGIPRWLFLLGVLGLIVLSFVATEWLSPKAKRGFRYNLLGTKRAYAIARSRWIQPVAQMIGLVIFVFLIWAGLTGSRVANITPVAVWTIWWGGLIFAVLLSGSMWCFACPWDGIANLGSRLRLAARVEPLQLGLSFPKWLANLYPAIALFVVLTWLELGYGVTTDPRWTAYMGLGMAAMAVMSAIAWDGKKFCAHGCPVGRICGIYSNFAPIELRARKPRACDFCKTEDCLNGNAKGYACPTGLSLKTLVDGTHCTMCGECIKSCNKNNVALNLRPFGSDLNTSREIRTDEAWLALMLLGLTLFHGLSMTPAWENFAPGSMSLIKWMTLHTGLPKAINFTIAMTAAMAIPVGLYWGASWLGSKLSKGLVSPSRMFRQFSWSLLPIALFYHLAHNLMHVLMEGGHIVPMLSNPLGQGDDWFGTAQMHVGSLIAEDTLWYVQVALILIGHVYGILVSHRIGHKLVPDRKLATRLLLPMLAIMILISIGGLYLMHLDMNMRVGRM